MGVVIIDGTTVRSFVEDEDQFTQSVDGHFAKLDLNNDGVLSRSELRKIFESMRLIETHFGMDESIAPEQLTKLYDSIFEGFDGDHNGTVDRDEFRSEIRKIMLAIADGLGSSPIQMVLEENVQDNLLQKAADLEASKLAQASDSADQSTMANGNETLAAKPFRIYIGYDPTEDLAYEVCKRSLLKRTSIPIEVHPIKQSELRSKGLYWRERGKLESTEFSFSRFLTPHLANFQGWAMFVDCDFLYMADIKELVDLIDDKYAVMCVQHDYAPKETTKMDGAVQTVYPRKNWSSMVLYNCGHPKNRALTPEVVSTQTGAYLHRFQWLEDNEIGSVPFVWNFLVGHNKVQQGDATTYPKAIHYTLGGPWFEAYKDCEFGDLWMKACDELKEAEKEV